MLSAAIVLCLSACVKEEMIDCADPRGNVHLLLRPTEDMKTRGDELGDFDITDARVWAFDADGRLVSVTPAERTPDGQYEAWMDLPSGNYDFVAWTGNGTAYKVAGTGDMMDKMELYLDRPYDAPITGMIPDLLYGNVKGRDILANTNNSIEVGMNLDTYEINVTAKGLERGSDIWETSIYKNGTHFLFDHTILQDNGVFRHIRSGKLTDSGSLDASIRIIAPGEEGVPKLLLRNTSTGEVRYDRSLVDTIMEAYAKNGQTVDLEHTYTYDIVLTFEGSMGVTVSVNGWEYDTEPTDLE
jgi:hypothetical protein